MARDVTDEVRFGHSSAAEPRSSGASRWQLTLTMAPCNVARRDRWRNGVLRVPQSANAADSLASQRYRE